MLNPSRSALASSVGAAGLLAIGAGAAAGGASPLALGVLTIGAALLGGAVPFANLVTRKIEQQHRDPLTGTLNRPAFQNALAASVLAASGQEVATGFGVCFIDLDGFKAVNDTYGHAAGDTLLKTVAARIAGTLRTSDVICRQGGDEFVIILYAMNEEELESVCQRILSVVANPVEIGGGRCVSVTASIGVSIFRKDSECAEEILRHADTAMYEAKRAGKSRVAFYSRSMGDALSERIEISSLLRSKLASRGMEVWFQPQVDIQKGVITGGEALLRWDTGSGKHIPVQKLISIAEESRLICDIGNFVLESAARAIVDTQREGVFVRIAVNISPAHFRYTNVARDILHRLDVFDADPSFLEVEITESVLMKHDAEIDSQLAQLREAGVRIVLDDFGTGYSNFAMVNRSRVDSIKIDKSFVKNFPQVPERAAIVHSILLLAKRLGIDVVAEGVEAVETADALRSDGCRYAQGHLYAPAIPFKRFMDVLHTPQSYQLEYAKPGLRVLRFDRRANS